jgi:hypothetical protein
VTADYFGPIEGLALAIELTNIADAAVFWDGFLDDVVHLRRCCLTYFLEGAKLERSYSRPIIEWCFLLVWLRFLLLIELLRVLSELRAFMLAIILYK